MSEHELLLRHASNWARQRGKTFDADLLESALELRSGHDALPDNEWPTGSVEHLMLHRWPAHGLEVPDPDALADSLDTFVRFLRVTGRMASGSGDPRALAREAHRAAPKMAAACADSGSYPDDAFGDDTPVERGDPARAARQAESAPLVQTCLRLTEWVGRRREVTGTGVLRLAEAKQAYAELELWRWEQDRRAIVGARPLADPTAFVWKRAGESLALDRYWYAMQSAQLVETRATVARAAGRQPRSDEDWVMLALSLLFALWKIAEGDELMSTMPVLTLLGGCAIEGSMTDDEVKARWRHHEANPWTHVAPDERGPWVDEVSDEDVALSLHLFADTGIWTVDDGTYRLTDLGREFTVTIFAYLEETEGVDGEPDGD